MGGQPINGKLQNYDKGDILIHENELSRKMFVLRNGKVRVYKTHAGQKITLAILGGGEIFGEMSFFDSKPRSATVEALTPIEVYVIGSEEADRQLNGMPEWFQPIIKTVFSRLRATDMRTTVLQSMNEVEKRHFKRDSVAAALYTELLRFNKMLMVLHQNAVATKKPIRSDEFQAKLEDLLGERIVSLRSYWRLLKEYDFIDRVEEENRGLVVLKVPNMEAWSKELAAESESGRHLFLGHSAVAILKRLVGFLSHEEVATSDPASISVSHMEIDLSAMPLYEEALEELIGLKILSLVNEKEFSVKPDVIFRTYTYQSLLKCLDYSTFSVD